MPGWCNGSRADILPSPCQLLQFGPAWGFSHSDWPHLRARLAWRNGPGSEGDSRHPTAHAQSARTSRLRCLGGSEKMLKYSCVLHLNTTSSIFPLDIRLRLTVRRSHSFQNLIILPEFCQFASPATRGAGERRRDGWVSVVRRELPT